jgi:hypothetical protein
MTLVLPFKLALLCRFTAVEVLAICLSETQPCWLAETAARSFGVQRAKLERPRSQAGFEWERVAHVWGRLIVSCCFKVLPALLDFSHTM